MSSMFETLRSETVFSPFPAHLNLLQVGALSLNLLGVSVGSLDYRAELKVTHPKVTEPNLRFPAVFLRKSAVSCEYPRFSAVSCTLQMLGISRRRGESAKICGFLRKSAFWALSVTLVPSP